VSDLISISVAMGTYNGAECLQEQLDSLVAQTLQPYELIICDDGSTDGTLAIAEHFAANVSFPVRIFRNEKQLGFSDNFLKAASLCKGEWIAFCDQDDVWLPEKLNNVAQVVKSNPDIKLVLQNALICDSNLNHDDRVFPDKLKSGLYHEGQIYGHWVWLGFLQTVRADLIQQVDFTHRPINHFREHPVFSHDMWTCFLANALGGAYVLDKPVALYRRHGNTVTGTYQKISLTQRIKDAIETGSEHYRNLREASDSSAEVMRYLSGLDVSSEWSEKFRNNADQYVHLSSLLNAHCCLYESGSIAERLRNYILLWLKGGYVGSAFTAVGWKVAVKDFILAVLNLRQLFRRASTSGSKSL